MNVDLTKLKRDAVIRFANDASDILLSDYVNSCDARIEAKLKVIQEAQDALLALCNCKNILQDEQTQRRRRSDPKDIEFLLDAYPENQSTYTELQKIAGKYELFFGGVWGANSQRCLNFGLNAYNTNKINDTRIKGLKYFLEYIKPCTIERDHFYGTEFDSTIYGCKPVVLMSSGCYRTLFFRKDGTVFLRTIDDEGETSYIELGDFNNAMCYIKRRCPSSYD